MRHNKLDWLNHVMYIYKENLLKRRALRGDGSEKVSFIALERTCPH